MRTASGGGRVPDETKLLVVVGGVGFGVVVVVGIDADIEMPVRPSQTKSALGRQPSQSTPFLSFGGVGENNVRRVVDRG